MAKKRKPAIDPALKQRAKATAFLQTNAEAQTLTQLLRGAASEYAGQVAVEKGAAQGVVNTANAAIPKVKAYYNTADQNRAASQAYVDQRFAPLGHIADDIKAGSAAEAAGFMRRLGETRASTLGEFQSRKVDAKAGAAFAVRAARDRFRQDSGEIKSQIVNLQRRKGVITTVALNDALDAEAQAAQARRQEKRLWAGTKETQRHNRATESQASANASDKKAAAAKKKRDATLKDAAGILGSTLPPRAGTPASRENARGRFETGVSLASTLAAGGVDKKTGKKIPPATREEIVAILTPKLKSAVLARAAAQKVLRGGVGPKTRKRAHRRYGISLPKGKRTVSPPVAEVQRAVGGYLR